MSLSLLFFPLSLFPLPSALFPSSFSLCLFSFYPPLPLHFSPFLFYQSICTSICQSLYLLFFICTIVLSICLSVYLFIYLSIYLSSIDDFLIVPGYLTSGSASTPRRPARLCRWPSCRRPPSCGSSTSSSCGLSPRAANSRASKNLFRRPQPSSRQTKSRSRRSG